MAGALLVVALRGTVNIPHPVRRILTQLGLTRRYRGTIVPDDPVHRGMLNRAKHFLGWAALTPELALKLVENRVRREGWHPLDATALRQLGVGNARRFATRLAKGDINFRKLKGIKPFFGLHPPRGGFKRSTRRLYGQGGILGENPELPQLVARML